MANENIKAFYVGNTNEMIITDSTNNILTQIKIGDVVDIRKDIDELQTLDGFYLYEGMKNQLTGDYKSLITGFEIGEDSGIITLELNDSGYSFPITVLEVLQGYNSFNIKDYMDLLYNDVNIHEVAYGDRLRVKPNVVIGGTYGLYNNVRYTPEQFSDFSGGYETHELALPGEFVKIIQVDTYDNTVYCADENEGITLWYGIEMLQKPREENITKEHDDEFLTFLKALREVAEFNEIEVPQVEVEEEPNISSNDTQEAFDSWLLSFDDDDDDDDYNDFVDNYDYDDDLIDERYNNHEFNFYKALEELKIMETVKQENEIWVMTNGERTFTFRDERLVSVRLADSIENFVYFSATIQMDDLDSNNWNWKIVRYVDEETEKLNEIITIAESLKDKSLMLDLLDIIGRYRG